MSRGAVTRVIIALSICTLIVGRALTLQRNIEAERTSDPVYARELSSQFGADLAVPLLFVAGACALFFLLGMFRLFRVKKLSGGTHVFFAIRPKSFVKIMPDVLSVIGRDHNDGVLGTFAGLVVTKDGIEFWRGLFVPHRAMSIPRESLVKVKAAESDDFGFMGGAWQVEIMGNDSTAQLDFGILDPRLGFIVPMSSGRLRQLLELVPVG
jgi:hypothetical protein